MKHLSCVVLFILFFSPSLFGQNFYTYSEPEKLDDGWETNSIQSLNIDTSRIYQLFSQLKNGNHKVHSILLVKDGQLVIDEYFDDYSANKQHDLRSATKSITSLLMGIALDKGFIDSIDDPFIKYINQPAPRKNQDSRKEQITIRHLLTMSTGLDCNDWDRKSKGQEDRVYRQDDWLQYFLDLPMINDPGTVSSYCTMGQVLATEIISRASGMPIDSFAERYLFRPLHIENVSWGHTSKKEVIASAKRLYMTPRDMFI
jgi:CubicO group peptidase (beta-lactamase class C family)